MLKAPLGRIEKFDPREYWKSESAEFTPWLAQPENIGLLAQSLGLELEVVATEKDVGPFRADILCKDVNNNHYVLIENQLEATDHLHLGQLLTYASGLDAVTIIWIAKQVREEHRAALDWLNRVTDESINFFGIEVVLLRIGNSSMAPEFVVVSKPNDWSREVKTGAQGATELTGTRQLQLEYWTMFRNFMQGHPTIRCQKPQPCHWMNHAIGRSWCHLTSIASAFDSVSNTFRGENRVDFLVHGDDSRRYFEKFKSLQSEIEHEIGEPLTWHAPEGGKQLRIYIRKSVDIANRDDWAKQHEWLKEKLELFYKVFGSRVMNLTLDN